MHGDGLMHGGGLVQGGGAVRRHPSTQTNVVAEIPEDDAIAAAALHMGCSRTLGLYIDPSTGIFMPLQAITTTDAAVAAAVLLPAAAAAASL